MSTSPSVSLDSYRKVSSILEPESLVFTFNLHLNFSSKIEKYEVDIPKSVLIFLPIVFSQARGSAAALDLLEAGSFSFDIRLQTRFPQENWDELFSSSYTACKLAIGRKNGLRTMLRRLKLIVYRISLLSSLFFGVFVLLLAVFVSGVGRHSLSQTT